MVHLHVMLPHLSPLCLLIFATSTCFLRICLLRIMLPSLHLFMAIFSGPPRGDLVPLLILTERSLISIGRLLTGSFILPSALSLLVFLFLCPDFVVRLLSLLSTFSFLVSLLKVCYPGLSPSCLIFLTCVRSYYVIMLSLVLARMSCVSLRGFLFIFLTFASWSSGVPAINFRFRDVRPSATSVPSPRRQRYFHRQWGSRGVIASVSAGQLSLNIYTLSCCSYCFVVFCMFCLVIVLCFFCRILLCV